jgi:choline dehydrogenase-like flavoprotein
VDGGGIFHPAGTIRLGIDATRDVVDTSVPVHGLCGVSLVATFVFLSVWGTRPSPDKLQLALCVASDIAAAA